MSTSPRSMFRKCLCCSKYQRTEISAQQAIDAVQALANQISYYELRLEEPFQALRFLRDELEAQQGDAAEGEEGAPG